MASPTPPLTIVFAPEASAELKGIYAYNANERGAKHADGYEDFLLSGIAKLATDPERGRTVEDFPDRRAVTLKRRTGGYGHVVIYRVDQAAGTLRIIHIFHTSQDIQGRMKDEL